MSQDAKDNVRRFTIMGIILMAVLIGSLNAVV